MEKKSCALLRLVVCSFVLIALTTPPPAICKEWKVKFSAGYPPTSPFSIESRWYLENVAKNSDGRIKPEYYYGGSICKLGQEMNAFRARTIDATCYPTSYSPASVPLMQIFDLTYLTTAIDANSKAVMDCYHRFAPLQKQFDSNNAVLLWSPPATNNTLWTTFPAPNMAALKGKRIRATGWSGDVLSLFGASAVALVWGDIYNSARTGVISGAYGTPLALGWDSKFYEVMPYVTQTGAGTFGPVSFMVRKDLFDEFPPDLQKVFLDWALRAEDESIKIVMEENAKAVADMAKRGIKCTIWSPEEVAKAAGLAKSVQFEKVMQKFVAEGMGNEAQQLKDMYLSVLNKLEKTSKYVNEFDYWHDKYGKN